MTESDQRRQLIIGMSNFHSVSVWLFTLVCENLKYEHLYEWEEQLWCGAKSWVSGTIRI